MIFPLRFFPEDFYFFHPAPELLCGAGARVPFSDADSVASPYVPCFAFVGRLTLPVLLHPLGLYSTKSLAPNLLR